MKRKLALLLAAVMMLSLLPMNVYAASDNRFSRAPSVVPEGTVMYEDGWQDTATQLLEFGENDYKPGENLGDGVEYYLEGTDLLIYPDNEVAVGGTFRLRLDGAEWFFRHTGVTGPGNSGVNTSWNLLSARNTTVYSLLRQVERNGAAIRLPALGANSAGVLSNVPVSTERWGLGNIQKRNNVATRLTPELITYDPNKGVYVPDTVNVDLFYGQYGKSGTYIRTSYGTAGVSPLDFTYPNTFEIPYKLEVSKIDARDAMVTILYANGDPNILSNSGVSSSMQIRYPKSTGAALTVGDPVATTAVPLIRIPLVTRTTGETDVRVSILESNLTSITNNTYLYGNVGASATNTYVLNPETARTDFVWDQLIIKEERIGSIKNNDISSWSENGNDTYADFIDRLDRYYDMLWQISSGGLWTNSPTFTDSGSTPSAAMDSGINEEDIEFFTIQLPTGFEFNVDFPNVYLGVDLGIEWREKDATYTARGKRKWKEKPAGQSYPNFVMKYGEDGRGNPDRSVLRVWLYGILPSTRTAGLLYFEGIEFTALDNSKYGDFDAIINRGNKDKDLGITSQSFKAGTRADWTILLKAISEIPTLVNGRYDGATYMTARDDVHKTAKVQFGENSVNAWWSERDTIFYLPEGVKFRRVEVTKAENFADEKYQDDTRSGSRNYNRNPLDDPYADAGVNGNGVSGDGVYIGDAQKRGVVTVDGSEMTWTNLALRHNKKGLVEMDLWVSIRSGFEDDVTLGVRGSAIPDQPGEVPPIVIARSVSPITVDTRVTDILIGYQDQKTNDVIIKETAAGMLQRNKEILLSITDMISADMLLSPTTTVNVTDGDIKLKDIGVVGGSSNFGINPWTGKANTDLGTTGGTIAFKIDRASSVASTITLSNVSVKIDRTVPLTNDRPYMVVVWGEAVAANFGSENNDMFSAKWAGIMVDYIAVVSSANDESSILTNEVWVTIGDTYYVVNGKTMDMDAAAYVSEASNSTMVPLRFLSEALGIAPENIIWIDNGPDDRHVVVNAPNRVLRFTIGSSTLISNGTPILMLSPDNLEVSPEIKGDRTYVPFRAVGEAFGVPVSWDSRTKTAKYNEGRYKG